MTPDTPKPPAPTLSDQLYAAWTVLERVMPSAAEMYRPLFADILTVLQRAEPAPAPACRCGHPEDWHITDAQETPFCRGIACSCDGYIVSQSAPAPASAETLEQLQSKIDKAQKELSAMCERQWAGKAAIDWRIPADPTRDSDLVISDGLMAGDELLRRLQSTEQKRDAAQKPSEGGNVFADIGLEHPEIHLHWSNKLIAMQQRAEAAEQKFRDLEEEKGTR